MYPTTDFFTLMKAIILLALLILARPMKELEKEEIIVIAIPFKDGVNTKLHSSSNSYNLKSTLKLTFMRIDLDYIYMECCCQSKLQ